MITLNAQFFLDSAHMSNEQLGMHIRCMLKEQEHEKLKTIEERKIDFVNKVAKIADFDYHDVDKAIFLKFCDYWTEHNDNGKKMRFEKQKTWNLSLRIATWLSNDKNFNNGKYRAKPQTQTDFRADAKDILG